jgi:hypothetical protein
MGRESESFTAGCAPPVATPIPEAVCFVVGLAGCWPVEPSVRNKTERITRNKLAAETSFERRGISRRGIREVI